jgi:hypothetical protein
MKTISEVRKSFWLTFTEFKSEYRTKKRQNSYNATIRSAFVDYVDSLAKDGAISEKLSNRVTL